MDHLAEEVVGQLGVLAGLKDDALQALLDHTVSSLLSSSPLTEEEKKREKEGGVVGRQARAALSTLLLEAARVNLDPKALEGILEEQKVGAGGRQMVVGTYQAQRGALRGVLARTHSFHAPRLVDVDWRLDYFLKANSVERINEPLFRLVLDARDQAGAPVPVELACTLDQLQDLVAKLKDASKQLERSAGRS